MDFKGHTFTILKRPFSLIKLQSNSSRQIWRQASAKIERIIIQPNYYSLEQFKREVKIYHFTDIIFWHALSH